MGVLILNLVGVNAYVPHTDKTALLAVMPNASRLGSSPAEALDGAPLARHLPFLWEEASDFVSVLVPYLFPGAQLSFRFGGTPSALDLSAIMPIAQKGWLELDDNVLGATPDSRVSGQVLVTDGTAEIYKSPGSPCYPAWSPAGFPNSLEPMVPGLTFRIEDVTSVTATAATWVGAGDFPAYHRPNLGTNDTVTLYVGNLCAEDVFGWPRNSIAGRTTDSDFKWIYGLSKSPDLLSWVSGGLPAPAVQGSGIPYYLDPSDAFDRFWGGGGGAGCECNGLLDKPRTF